MLAVLAGLSLLVGTACDPRDATGAFVPWVDLRVLVVDDGSPMVGALAERLAQEGVATTRIDLSSPTRPTLTHAFLGSVGRYGARANFVGVVVPSEATPGLSASERSTLADYERGFGIREVVAYTWANPAVGLNYAEAPGYIGPVDGLAATVTTDGFREAFGYLDGSLVLDDLDPAVDESFGYLATPLADDPSGGIFTPLLTATIPGTSVAGSLIGMYDTVGREQLVTTFATNGYQEHFKVLSHGIISWLTKGMSTSSYRNHFSVQVDDVFLPDDRWSIDGNCTIGDGCDPAAHPPEAPGSTIRMTAADGDAAAAWQDANDFQLDLAFNGAGSEEAGPGDPLTSRLLALRSRFRWTNHTWSHPYLGCTQDSSVSPWTCLVAGGVVQWASQATIRAEIDQNLAWAIARGIPLDRTELVTGEHSGLRSLPQMPDDNPNLSPALAGSGISWVASDASREAEPRRIGSATTVPRHPMNIFYNTGTRAEAVDEYNWIYTSRANGGSGICEDNPATTTCIAPLDLASGFDDHIVPLEERIAFGHVVGMSPRPHYAHQSNLAEDRILYPVLAGVLARYRETFADNTPLVNERLASVGRELARHQAWRATTDVHASVQGTRLVVTNAGPSSATVPLTTPPGTRDVLALNPNGTILLAGGLMGSSYAGHRSTWVTVGSMRSVTYQLSIPAPFRAPLAWPLAAPAAAVPPATPIAVTEGPTTEEVVVNEAVSERIEEATREGEPG